MTAVCSSVAMEAMEVAITDLPAKKQAPREAFAALLPTLLPSSRPLRLPLAAAAAYRRWAVSIHVQIRR